ncbi:MAG: hypothetical protein Q9223_003219 [Gallowayella weberi]
MEHTSIEDFQRFHNRYSGALSRGVPSRSSSIQPQPPPVPSIEHDYNDGASLSGSAHHSSGPDEAVFDVTHSRHSSPRTSNHSNDDESISSFFSESREISCPPERQSSSLYTPLKFSSPFRNPSSVRAMQMETTPPPYIPSSQTRQRSTFPTPSRKGTPKSIRSGYSGMRMCPSKGSPTKRTSVKKEYPLVLLHVTLLPIPQIYSAKVMEQVLPSCHLENWKVLREKATDTVLERGILIPHPKEDYDLLEERLLESLGLRTPRILKCGHFHLDADQEADIAESDSNDDDEENDADICDDCGRRVRDGRYGSGAGNRRWDIKVYAANGLMRAGAWGAAWREMERVDVEITPWMDEDVKRELALRTEEERKHAVFLQEEAVPQGDHGSNMDEERMREIYGDHVPIFTDLKGQQMPPSQFKETPYPRQEEVPLQDLLKTYLVAAAQDRKNIAIVVLSLVVLYLSLLWRPMSMPTSGVSPQTTMASFAPSISPSSSAHPPITSMDSDPIIESSVAEPSETPTTSTVLQEGVEPTASSASAPSSEDTVNTIEALFEFADE